MINKTCFYTCFLPSLMMMICIAPKWNNADKIRITISRIIGSSSIQAKWKIAQKESNYVTFYYCGKTLYCCGKTFYYQRENFILLRENILPSKENFFIMLKKHFTMAGKLFTMAGNFLLLRETFYHQRKTF